MMGPVTDATYDPESHYDRVTDAWGLLLGEELHYGVFADADDPLPTATRRLTMLMADAAQVAADIEILDVGCGTGGPACFVAETSGARVTGITTSAVGIDAARARAAAAGLSDRTAFEVRDGMDNGFPDATFDVAWVLESSHLMRNRPKLIAECARVLRPGGRLALCDIMLRRPMPFEEVRRLRKPLGLLREVFGDAHMESLDRYRELATDAGLTVVDATDLTADTRPTFTRWRENAARYRDEVVASIGQDDWQRFVDSCDVLEGFWDDGTLGYGLLAATKPA
jgi:27-O-demethylrifamycin SV methyltransferase